jgi:hypothetical protein
MSPCMFCSILEEAMVGSQVLVHRMVGLWGLDERFSRLLSIATYMGDGLRKDLDTVTECWPVQGSGSNMLSRLFAVLSWVMKSPPYSYNALDPSRPVSGLAPQARLDHFHEVSIQKDFKASDTRFLV